MVVNYDDPNLYEHLLLITDAFEKEALRSGKRNGFMVAAQGPLTAMDNLLSGSDQVLAAASSRASQRGRGIEGEVSISDPAAVTNPRQRTEAEAKLSGGVEFDADLLELLFPGGADGESAVRNYLSECLNCDLRLQFDWQLKPLNLLGPIEGLLQSIEAAIDSFTMRIDPFRSLEGICNLMNGLRGFCIPDLIMIVMSLKLLLKKYTLGAIEVKLDWTTVLAPLLKLILEGIVSLLDSLMAIILAPLDCTISGLAAANQVEKETRSLLATIEQVMGSSGGLSTELEAEFGFKDLKWLSGDSGPGEAPDPGSLEVTPNNASQGREPTAVRIPTSFNLKAGMTLEEALADPSFANATFLDQLLLPLQEAKQYIQDLVSNLNKALHSLNALTSGGLAVNLQRLGILMFLADMISLMMMIIRMMRTNRNVTDWCDWLRDNPSELEQVLRSRYGDDVSVETADRDRLVLRKGPRMVGEIGTCANKRSGVDSALLDQWIKELEGGI